MFTVGKYIQKENRFVVAHGWRLWGKWGVTAMGTGFIFQ